MQTTSLVMLLLIKVLLAKDGGVLVKNKSCSVVLEMPGAVTMTEMLEYTAMVDNITYNYR